MVNFLFVWSTKTAPRKFGKSENSTFASTIKNADLQKAKYTVRIRFPRSSMRDSKRKCRSCCKRILNSENIVDKNLIGGIKIQVDGKMIDRSIRGDLDAMLRSLKNI